MVLRVPPDAILISGTPGTGKTTLGRALAESLGAPLISTSPFAEARGCCTEYDQERDTWVVDLDALESALCQEIGAAQGPVVVEGHLADCVPPDLRRIVVILRCDPRVLGPRLEVRGYSPAKVRENLQCEILAESTSYFVEDGHGEDTLFEIDVSRTSPEQTLGLALAIVRGEPPAETRLGRISWMSTEGIMVEEYFD
jgi:adenylate kinase